MNELDDLLEIGFKKNASDLHLVSNQPPLFRIKGCIHKSEEKIYSTLDLKQLLYPLISDTHQSILDTQKEIDFTYENAQAKRARTHIYHQSCGISATFRLISDSMPTFETLKLPHIFETLSHKKNGLILITGPTGSGKSSSLAALIHHINQTQAKHVITLEDPIEFKHHSNHSLITQRELYKDTLSFNKALKSALRQDPDIICISELRDLDSIRLALTAAETGHLVLATLHTASAVKTLDRIIDVFPGGEKEMIRLLLAESLVAIIAQQLCFSDEQTHALFEVMQVTSAIKHLIRENKHAQIHAMMQTKTIL